MELEILSHWFSKFWLELSWTVVSDAHAGKGVSTEAVVDDLNLVKVQVLPNGGDPVLSEGKHHQVYEGLLIKKVKATFFSNGSSDLLKQGV